MTKSQALHHAVKLWGKAAAVQDYGQPSSPEKRATASAALDKMRAQKEPPGGYTKEQRKAKLVLVSDALYYRYTVGTVMSMAGLGCFLVKGQGDTWEAAFDKAK